MKILKLCSVLIILSVSGSLWSQTLIKKNVFSEEVNDSISLKIWLPKDYSETQKYPILYEFVYDHTDLISATLNNIYNIPKTIVVFVKLEIGEGYYQSPNLDAKGIRYYKAFKNEIIPYMEKEYRASKFRIATGLSQGADYTNYILRNNPELFSAYLVFAIERPYYDVDFKTYVEGLREDKYYFIGIAGEDVEERISFADSLYDNLKKNKKMNILKKDYPNVEHRYGLLYGLSDAIFFLYKNYINTRDKESDESIDNYYTNVYKEYDEIYGVEPSTNSFIAKLAKQIKEEENTKSIEKLIDMMYANDEVSNADFWALGQALTKLGFYDQSEKAYLFAIDLYLNESRNKLGITMGYTGLSKVYVKAKKIEQGYDILVKGHKKYKSDDLSFLYHIGKYAITNAYKIEEGINAFEEVNKNRTKASSLLSDIYTEDVVYAYISYGYYKLKKNHLALKFANKSLLLNPENKTAKSLMTMLNK